MDLRSGVTDIIDTHRARLTGITNLTLAEFCDPLGRDLSEHFVDGHLKARLQRAPQTQESAESPALELTQYGSVEVVNVRRLYFLNQSDQEILDGIESWRPAAETETIVFDFRGCPGGDDSYICNWIENSIAGDVALGPLVRRTGPERLVDEWNQLVALGADLGWDVAKRLIAKHPDHFAVLDAQRPITEQLAHIAGMPSGIEDTPLIMRGKADSPMRMSIVALIDGKTGSSAESSTICLRTACDATVIGVPSYGCVDWGNVVNYPLPGTGTKWCLPTHTSRGGDGPFDLVGIKPDVTLDDPNMPVLDALQAASSV